MRLSFMGGMGIAFCCSSCFFALEWFYPVVFELGRVGRDAGQAPPRDSKSSWTTACPSRRPPRSRATCCASRTSCRFCYGFAIVSMLLRTDCKRLGDIAAATLVVHQPRMAPKIALDQVEPRAPARPLAPRDQAAVIALAARAPRLTGERLDELAALAAPVSGDDGRSGPEVTRRVLGVAQWLLGRR